ncbi:MAG: NFACT RNA binding domain-containing protein [Oscillatoria sp. PMC 1051.18]|nr:NFACT RNA binding domain-containing protein [Oscillatoria sp. PMC 1050.18]MEC5030277.1 NFACT RNA binding domain-containing protein [Oscillatoria sp. PMC 1051.18]
MQPVDFTTLTAARAELLAEWVPAKIEQVYQRDRYNLTICLRTLKKRGWIDICWHPQAARICVGDPPPRIPDTFSFSDRLRHQLKGLALINLDFLAPWERVLDLQFAQRPGEIPIWHLYVEVMGKYSNVILTDAQNTIVTTARQISAKQSSVRPIQTGQPYEVPPPLTNTAPSLSESLPRWQERVSLVPGKLARQLLKSYRGLSPNLARSLVRSANLDPEQSNQSLSEADWEKLGQKWQEWLQILENADFTPGWTKDGYTVLGWNLIEPTENVSTLLNTYYTNEFNRQTFAQLHHQLQQKIANLLQKQRQKAEKFLLRLQESDEADEYRQQADLLMAHLQAWEPGMKSITLTDFETGEPVEITLNPEKNAVQNAQTLYKRHQKLKRARTAVEPLLREVEAEINYLEQVEDHLAQLSTYHSPEDLHTLEEIRDELIQEGYFDAPQRRSSRSDESQPYRFQTPSGFELLIGRNNRQNDYLTFRTASDYDLWFHTQEIAGSHVLLRLDPGAVASDRDLQFAADLTARYSRARQSEMVPVVYTEPKNVYKPKGAKPGMAIYKHERVLWGQPHRANIYLNGDE